MLDATARVADREVGFTARARVWPVPPRRVRLAFHDLRVYGFLPVPAPMLVAALFATLGAQPGGGGQTVGAALPAGAPLLWTDGPTDLQIELVEAALLDPCRPRLAAARAGADAGHLGRERDARLAIRYRADDPRAPALPDLAG